MRIIDGGLQTPTVEERGTEKITRVVSSSPMLIPCPISIVVFLFTLYYCWHTWWPSPCKVAWQYTRDQPEKCYLPGNCGDSVSRRCWGKECNIIGVYSPIFISAKVYGTKLFCFAAAKFYKKWNWIVCIDWYSCFKSP